MDSVPPYMLAEPGRLSTNVVFNSPHSGRFYPTSFVKVSRLDAHTLRTSEDVQVDALFAAAPSHGAPLLCATAPRAWLDLNRAPDELDPLLIEGVGRRGLNQRVAAGLGVIPRVVSEGAEIYRGKLSYAEAVDRLERIHVPYHAKLTELLERARGGFGSALLLDCHSMPSEALRAAPRVRGACPEVVLGDRFGAAAGRALVALVQSAFEEAGFIVARNAPFAGGYITQRYGRPMHGFHAVQIEIDRGLYLDQKTLELSRAFDEITERITGVIALVTQTLPDQSILAAE